MKKLANAAFALGLMLLLSCTASAQSIWGFTDISYDDSSNTVTANCETDLDYDIAIYYEARVTCRITTDAGVTLAGASGVDTWQTGEVDVTIQAAGAADTT